VRARSSLKDLRSREKLRKDRPSKFVEGGYREVVLGRLQGKLQVCVQGDEFCGRTSRHFVDFKKKTDGRNSPRRFREVPRVVGSLGGAGSYSAGVEGSKLRRAGAVDRDHEERWFYSWIGISGVREVRLQIYATEVAI
jgi:hypothetical protein